MIYQVKPTKNPNLPLVEQIFLNRGINDIQHYLNPTDEDFVNALELDNVREGARMLIKHIQAREKILVQVDSDCDGYTSAAILINYLNTLFPAYTQNYISWRVHPDKSHGINLDAVPEDVKLVIAPDASSNQYEVHEALSARECDVLVIDHHHADQLSPHACVINNQLCNYPTKALSGAGVVYKFCSYIDSLLGVNYADDFLDLSAVGIIADVMELTSYEVRRIIDKGLDNITNPLLKEMVKKQEFKVQGHLNPFKVAFYIAPLINAMNRSGNAQERLLLFESMLTFKAYEQIPSTKRGCSGEMETRVEQAVRTCANVKRHQEQARDNVAKLVEDIIEQEELLTHTLIAVRLPKAQAADKNLTGLIATQIANKYGHPTAILNEVIRDNVRFWEGSMRGAPNIPIKDTRQMFLDTGLVEYCEGHANAGGVSIKDSNFKALMALLDEQYKDIDFTPCYSVDAELSINDPHAEEVILTIARLEDYWGQGIEEPLIAFTNVKVTSSNIQMMKSNTMKITHNNISFIKFKASDEEYEGLSNSFSGREITIIGKCKINSWGGYENPQVFIEDYYIPTQVWTYYF